MKSIFSGYYGAQNSGDDAFVEVAAWGSKKYWQTDEQLFFAKQLPETITNTSHYFAHKNYLNFSRAIKDIFFSDIFAYAGGSTFHSALKRTDLRTYAKLKKQIGFKGKTGAIGISLGPFKNSEAEKSTIEYLKTLDFLALRDNKSYELAKSYNLPFTPIEAFDLAALLPEIYNVDLSLPKVFNTNEKVIGISVCNYESYTNGNIENEQRRNEFIVSIIKDLKRQTNIKFRFFVFNGNPVMGDQKLTNQIIEAVGSHQNFNYEILPYNPNVKQTFEQIASCDVVISTRLHASIFACYSNTPFFLIEYHRKCTDFLNDVGQSDNYRVLDAEVDSKVIVEQLEDILFKKNYNGPTNLVNTIKKAKLNFTSTINL